MRHLLFGTLLILACSAACSSEVDGNDNGRLTPIASPVSRPQAISMADVVSAPSDGISVPPEGPLPTDEVSSPSYAPMPTPNDPTLVTTVASSGTSPPNSPSECVT